MVLLESKLCDSIDASVKILDGYTSYGELVVEAQNSLKRLKEIINDPSPAGIEEGVKLSRKLNSMVGQYSSYVPRVALTIMNIMDWMQERA